MRRPTCIIQIGKFEFNFVTQVKIKSSWKMLTDTAMITLPRSLKWKDRFLKDEINVGDKVNIYLGYDFEEYLEFSGYIASRTNGVPVNFTCEDEMWKLKQTNITKSFKKVGLHELLTTILPSNIKFNAPQIDLGAFRIAKASAAKVLKSLKSKYGLCSFFRGNQLIVGYPYSQVDSNNQVEYVFERNIFKDRLRYVKADQVKVNVRAVSMMPNGGKIEVQLGDPSGESRSLHFYNLDKEELEKAALEQLSRLQFEGYRGRIKAPGLPFVQHSDTVSIQSLQYPERNGNYLVDEIEVSYGVNGYRRYSTLGPVI